MNTRIYVPFQDLKGDWPRREAFILARPFIEAGSHELSQSVRQKWSLREDVVGVSVVQDADILLVPYSINEYFVNGLQDLLAGYNRLCHEHGIFGFGYIRDDTGEIFPEFDRIVYFRMGGFRSQLSNLNQGFPVPLSDQLVQIYGGKDLVARHKATRPVVGFCGNASHSLLKATGEVVKLLRINLGRALKSLDRTNWEPLFPSAWNRATILSHLQRCKLIDCNFILREKYRGGAVTDEDRRRTTVEYFDNIQSSDYVLCVRGGGNFSVRFYETLMMGRIPVLINTDCLIPFEDQIDWSKHIIRIEWQERKRTAEIVANYHETLTDDRFVRMQESNRRLWKETLSVQGIMDLIVSKWNPITMKSHA